MKTSTKNALRTLGFEFTEAWKQKTEEPEKFIPFGASAEDCLRMVRKHRRFQEVPLILFVCGFFSLILLWAALKFESPNSALLGLITVSSIVASFVLKIWLNKKEPGTTHKEVAAAWKPVRKTLIKTGVVQRFEANMSSENFKQEPLEKVVRITMNSVLGELAKRLRLLQAEGRPDDKEQRLKKRLVSVFEELGLKRPNLQHFF